MATRNINVVILLRKGKKLGIREDSDVWGLAREGRGLGFAGNITGILLAARLESIKKAEELFLKAKEENEEHGLAIQEINELLGITQRNRIFLENIHRTWNLDEIIERLEHPNKMFDLEAA